MLAGLYVIGRLGSVGFAMGVAGFIAAIGLFMFATRRRPGRRYDKKAPSRADADLQTWDTSP
ncbi:MAG: hypothetical protein ACRDWS_00345 [Acidimicrobiia bacterium]